MSVLRTARDGAVLRLTLNRPDARNAFDEEVIAALTAVARSAREDATLRAVVLSGEGQTFCAGADLAWMSKAVGYSRNENLRDAEDLARMLQLLDALPVPLIARVQGAAFGGGAGLVAVCDIAVATDTTSFAFSEVKLGIMPAVISPYVLAKIGQSAARELFLTGVRFSAARAREIGLVHAVVPSANLDATVESYVNEVLSSAPAAIATAKQLIRDVSDRRPGDVMALTTGAIADLRVSAEGQEGMRAFLEKRKPRWRE
jgi:methylglutaconyl-CoA hydratase